MNDIENLNNSISDMTELEIDKTVVPLLLNHFASKINYFSDRLFGYSDIARKAFKEQASARLKKAMKTFVTRKHWLKGKHVVAYAGTTLKNLYNAERNSDIPKKIAYLCPACKFFGNKEICIYDNKQLSCNHCINEIDRIRALKNPTVNDLAKSKLCQVFALHSRTGFECPECKKFIPSSFANKLLIECPYDDCLWFGDKTSLRDKNHPSTSVFRAFCSISHHTNDILCLDTTPNGLETLSIKEQTSLEFDTLKNVIDTQSSRLLNYPIEKNIKKRLMYQAFSNMLEKCPEDMIKYLVHKKIGGDIPIQSQIFQEFTKLVENSLPFNIIKNQKNIEIFSLLDNDLDLFLGLSTFDAAVKEDGSIPNQTIETYIGGREMRDFGPCFIGYLCDIFDSNKNSLMNNVEYYTFAQIKLKDIEPGTQVTVKHLRIPSHYEMNGLVFLQRTRKKITNSVESRLKKL